MSGWDGVADGRTDVHVEMSAFAREPKDLALLERARNSLRVLLSFAFVVAPSPFDFVVVSSFLTVAMTTATLVVLS